MCLMYSLVDDIKRKREAEDDARWWRDNCRLQKAGMAFKREKQQLRRAPRKAAEKNKSAAQDANFRDQLGGESLCEAWVHIKASIFR